jgi:hypothetical protein
MAGMNARLAEADRRLAEGQAGFTAGLALAAVCVLRYHLTAWRVVESTNSRRRHPSSRRSPRAGGGDAIM